MCLGKAARVSETLRGIQAEQHQFKKCHKSGLFPLPVTLLLSCDSPTERERTERLIKTKLREIMMQKDLENITSKEVSGEGAAPEALLRKAESSLGREERPKEKISRGFLVFFLSTQIRTELEMQMVCNLREFKEFIDNEMIVILGQMDSPTQIFDHVFLVSLTASSTEFQL